MHILAKKLSIAMICVAACVGVVQAHHSFAAIWDESTSFTVTGTLAKVEWVNPHVYLYVDVPNAGKVDRYAFEGFAPPMLRGYGVRKDMFESRMGQTVTAVAYPPKDGTKLLGYGRTYKFSDGTLIVVVRDPAEIKAAGVAPGAP